MKLLTRHNGYLMLDHRASPGLPESMARPIGAPTGSKLFETETLWCAHCSTPYLKNPARTRPREYCKKCDEYICDFCGNAAALPGYVHRSFKELADLVRSGKWTLRGSASNPILVPVTKET